MKVKMKKILTMFMAISMMLSSSAFTNVALANAIENGPDTIVGAPTQKTWTFEASKAGTYDIHFIYSRSWEKVSADIKTAIYTVKVTDEVNTDKSVVALVSNQVNAVKKGQKFTVTLEENASTGYSWSYIIDNKGIVCFGSEKPPIVGAPVQKVWTFVPKKSGTYNIVFTYSRDWEKKPTDTKTVVYKIKVSKKNGSKSKSIELLEGKVKNVKTNQKIYISLEETPSSGYTWNYKASSKKIKLIDEKTLENPETAHDSIKFQGVISGSYKLVFVCDQPTEKDPKATKTVEYTVKVTDELTSDDTSVVLVEDKENVVKLGQNFYSSLDEKVNGVFKYYTVANDTIKVTE